MAAMTGLGKRSMRRSTELPKRRKDVTSGPEKAEPRSAPAQKILSPAPVMMRHWTVPSDSISDSTAFSSFINASLMALAGGRFRVTTAKESSRSRLMVSYGINDLLSDSRVGRHGDALEKDLRDRGSAVGERVAALAEHPGGRHLVHGAEEHLGGDLHGQVPAESPLGDALLEERSDQREIGADLLAQAPDELGHLVPEQGDEDVVLGPEVEIDGAGGDAGLARDVGDAGVVVALPREDPHGGLDDVLGPV